MGQHFRFVFQDTDTIDIPEEMVKHFEFKTDSWRWIMKISGAADVMYSGPQLPTTTQKKHRENGN